MRRQELTHEQEVDRVWMKLDPDARGFVNYRKVLYFSRMILPYFSMSR